MVMAFQTWCICHKFSISLTNYFVIKCLYVEEMVGLKYEDLPVDSFITVFIKCDVGLENRLIRAPLLGLAKSIYYRK